MAKFRYHVNHTFTVAGTTYTAGEVVTLDEVVALDISRRVVAALRFVEPVVEVDGVALLSTTGPDIALTLDDGPLYDVTAEANFTLTLPAVPAAGSAGLTLRLRQDATGGRAVTLAGPVRWAGGAAPTLSLAAAAVDVLVFISDPVDGVWDGFVSGLAMA